MCKVRSTNPRRHNLGRRVSSTSRSLRHRLVNTPGALRYSSGGAVEFDVEVGESEKAEIMNEKREEPTGA